MTSCGGVRLIFASLVTAVGDISTRNDVTYMVTATTPLITYPTAEQMLLLNFLMCSLFSAEWLEYLKCKSGWIMCT